MNYKRIYRELIIKARSENRIKTKTQYYENHHIIPVFMFKENKRNSNSRNNFGELEGDANDSKNLILLTPREHFLAHVLLYKMSLGTKFEYKNGAALILFLNIGNSSHARLKKGNFSGHSKKYDKYRKIGIESISRERKGKFPAKDAKTGVMVGSISVDDPRFLSGELVHHSFGRNISKKEREAISKRTIGSKNPNFKEMTYERKQRVFKCVSVSIVENHLIAGKFICEIKKEFTEFNKISAVWIKNNFGSYENLLAQYNELNKTEIIFNPYFKTKETRELNKFISSQFSWATDETVEIRVLKNELDSFLETNPRYRKGKRKNVKNNKNKN